MGWDFTKGASKSDIVEELLEPQSFTSYEDPATHVDRKTVAHRVVGAVLWLVVELTRTKDNRCIRERFIDCCLLANRLGYGWGYKSMSECEHPYYYSCPVEFLELAPEVNAEWRGKVRHLNADGAYRDSVMAP
jgi:hypothetical protein